MIHVLNIHLVGDKNDYHKRCREHVAKLARLELTEDEKVKFSKQLGDIFKIRGTNE